ncbi:unnamed protein product, partial [Gadus morhua 'NCC']
MKEVGGRGRDTGQGILGPRLAPVVAIQTALATPFTPVQMTYTNSMGEHYEPWGCAGPASGTHCRKTAWALHCRLSRPTGPALGLKVRVTHQPARVNTQIALQETLTTAAQRRADGVRPEFGDLVQIKKQLISVISLCKERGLVHSVKWASELAFALDPLPKDELPPSHLVSEEDVQDLDAFALAKSYFDLKEYDRAAYFLRGCHSKKAYFLYMYSRYLSGEKKKDDETVDSLGPLEKGQVRNEALRELRVELSKKHRAGELDGFTLYLYGVVLRKLDLLKEAVEVFVEATHTLPLHWGSWLELCNLVTNIEMLKSLSLPSCWIKDFFMAHIYTELQMIPGALQKYQSLIEAGFSKSTYIISQIAVAYHNIRDIDQALALFNELREQDPYRIENMDTFSNLLYVKSMKPELSYLAHNLVEIDKYRVETCCVI